MRIVTSLVYGEIIKSRFERCKSKRKLRKNRKASPLDKHTNKFQERYGDTSQIQKLRSFSAAPD